MSSQLDNSCNPLKIDSKNEKLMDDETIDASINDSETIEMDFENVELDKNTNKITSAFSVVSKNYQVITPEPKPNASATSYKRSTREPIPRRKSNGPNVIAPYITLYTIDGRKIEITPSMTIASIYQQICSGASNSNNKSMFDVEMGKLLSELTSMASKNPQPVQQIPPNKTILHIINPPLSNKPILHIINPQPNQLQLDQPIPPIINPQMNQLQLNPSIPPMILPQPNRINQPIPQIILPQTPQPNQQPQIIPAPQPNQTISTIINPAILKSHISTLPKFLYTDLIKRLPINQQIQLESLYNNFMRDCRNKNDDVYINNFIEAIKDIDFMIPDDFMMSIADSFRRKGERHELSLKIKNYVKSRQHHLSVVAAYNLNILSYKLEKIVINVPKRD